MMREQMPGSRSGQIAASWLRLGRQGCLGLVASLMLMSYCHANDVVTSYVLGGRPEKVYRENLERQAVQKVETARVACGLSTDQTEKLRRAASGDVIRAMQELSALRHATEKLNMSNPEENRTGFQLVQPFMQRVQNGIHGKGSLFAKYLEHSLDDSQKSGYQAYLAKKEQERNHLIVLNTVVAIDQRVPLLKAQRDKLVELIDKRPIPKISRNVESLLGFIRLGGIPKRELSEFLDAEQVDYILKICEPYLAIRMELR